MKYLKSSLLFSLLYISFIHTSNTPSSTSLEFQRIMQNIEENVTKEVENHIHTNKLNNINKEQIDAVTNTLIINRIQQGLGIRAKISTQKQANFDTIGSVSYKKASQKNSKKIANDFKKECKKITKEIKIRDSKEKKAVETLRHIYIQKQIKTQRQEVAKFLKLIADKDQAK